MVKKTGWLLVTAMVVVGCDPFDRELSKREAHAQLEWFFAASNESASSPESVLATDPVQGRGMSNITAIDAGALEGLWHPISWPEYMYGRPLSFPLTEKGKQLFNQVELGAYSARVELAQPLTLTLGEVLAVRGQENENTRDVDFSYEWDPPAVALRYIGARSGTLNGTAKFERIEGKWELLEVPLRGFRKFRRDPTAETAGRQEREQRCRNADVETRPLGDYEFEHSTTRNGTVRSVRTELHLSDVAFVVTQHIFFAGRHNQSSTRSHFWGDVLALNTEGERIEMSVLTARDRAIDRLKFGTYKIEIDDAGKASRPLSEAALEMSQAWTSWHRTFVGCLPEPDRPWSAL